jgi:hypothetical protein
MSNNQDVETYFAVLLCTIVLYRVVEGIGRWPDQKTCLKTHSAAALTKNIYLDCAALTERRSEATAGGDSLILEIVEG